LAEEEQADELVADQRVVAFRAELLRRWPELADMIAPWHHDLDWRQPWGCTDLADRFVGLTLPFGWKDIAELPVLAGAYGLEIAWAASLWTPAHNARWEALHDDRPVSPDALGLREPIAYAY
jgi:hypothetical protein